MILKSRLNIAALEIYQPHMSPEIPGMITYDRKTKSIMVSDGERWLEYITKEKAQKLLSETINQPRSTHRSAWIGSDSTIYESGEFTPWRNRCLMITVNLNAFGGIFGMQNPGTRFFLKLSYKKNDQSPEDIINIIAATQTTGDRGILTGSSYFFIPGEIRNKKYTLSGVFNEDNIRTDSIIVDIYEVFL